MPFQYTPFQNPYITSIASLISRGGDRQAQAALRLAEIEAGAGQQRADAWGGAIQGIGNTFASTMQAIPAELERQKEREYVAAQRARQGQAWDLEDEVLARKNLARERFRQAGSGMVDTPIGRMPLGEPTRQDVPFEPGGQPFRNPAGAPSPVLPSQTLVPGKNPYLRTQRGIELWDTEKFVQQAAVDGTIEVIAPYVQLMDSANATKNANLDSTITSAKETAARLAVLSPEALMEIAPAALDFFRDSLPESILQPLYQLLEAGDEPSLRRMLQQFSGAPAEKLVGVGPENILTPESQAVGEPGYIAQRPSEPLVGVGPGNILTPRAQAVGQQGYRAPPPSEPLVQVGENRILTPRSEAAGLSASAGASVGRAVTSGDAGRISELNTSLDDLAVLGNTLFPDAIGEDMETEAMTGTRAWLSAGAPEWITELTGWGADAKGRQAVIDRVKQVIGKALEGGVLRKEDEYKYTKILPTIKDIPQVVKTKLDGLKAAILLRRERFIEALTDAGYNTTAYTERLAGTVLLYRNGEEFEIPTGAVDEALADGFSRTPG
jgi:hypothetical protein